MRTLILSVATGIGVALLATAAAGFAYVGSPALHEPLSHVVSSIQFAVFTALPSAFLGTMLGLVFTGTLRLRISAVASQLIVGISATLFGAFEGYRLTFRSIHFSTSRATLCFATTWGLLSFLFLALRYSHVLSRQAAKPDPAQ